MGAQRLVEEADHNGDFGAILWGIDGDLDVHRVLVRRCDHRASGLQAGLQQERPVAGVAMITRIW